MLRCVDAVVIEPPRYACVVAADEGRGIGRGNDLPWPRLPADGAFLRRITTTTRDPARRNAVIMGRRTWDSLPAKFRPLPGRFNIVVSRSATAVEPPEAAAVAGSLDRAIEIATTGADAGAGIESIFVLGGGQLYAVAVADPRCEAIYYTHVAARFDCDTVFPAFEDRFVLDAEDPPRTDNGITYWFQRWRRRHTIGP
jgi:dihydrofolate reductase / thymidylate synthase